MAESNRPGAQAMPLATFAGALLLVALACWMIWATRTLVEVRNRRIVSVSLTALVQDFVAREAQMPGASDRTTERTRFYLAALDRAIAEEARSGTVVLAAEATLGRSVPDRTTAVRGRLARLAEGPGGER